jgi:hypothetical protein
LARIFGHQPYRRLRGVVGHVNVLAADDAGDRRQIDDRPAAIGDHDFASRIGGC